MKQLILNLNDNVPDNVLHLYEAVALLWSGVESVEVRGTAGPVARVGTSGNLRLNGVVTDTLRGQMRDLHAFLRQLDSPIKGTHKVVVALKAYDPFTWQDASEDSVRSVYSRLRKWLKNKNAQVRCLSGCYGLEAVK